MEGKDITIADLIIKVVQDGQLAADEEDRVWELLAERKGERLRTKSCRCLADLVTCEMGKLLADKISDMRKRVGYIYRQCIRETRIGNLDLPKLSDAEVRKLIILATESTEMDNEDRRRLLTMIQMALNAADKEQGQGIGPFSDVLYDFIKAEERITYIKNPYTESELQKIMGWLDKHTHDMRGLAVAMWFAGGVTAEEIVGLRKESLMDADGVCIGNPTVIKKNGAEDYIILAGRRGRIVRDALKLHGDKDLEYIFMSDDREGGKKMLGRSLPLKVSFICRELGIVYRPFKCTDAIK